MASSSQCWMFPFLLGPALMLGKLGVPVLGELEVTLAEELLGFGWLGSLCWLSILLPQW